ncbi:zonular occludens toxin domain-containing protein [Pseudomonas aeruginosa]|uniref:zonular occludens toxin domain-containing protein n=1 Tax=Pseudomonas aeruginosa TaxID=287 RepID=UPI0024C07131|nr:zonular occludens toxin domain-containing protein [Pseudomonas aeruginosa]WHV73995.1 zonular occludens toxin domain-containing protein [Pseudomonas aeruginosa]
MVEFDTPEEWYNLPDGSVIVIDEAQRCSATMAPERARRRSRASKRTGHQGLDIHLITQHPSLLCTPVRKLVGKHINFIRPYGREKGIFRHEYEFCIDNPERRSNFKQAQEERVTLDKAYFRRLQVVDGAHAQADHAQLHEENPADHRADADPDRRACWACRDRDASGE